MRITDLLIGALLLCTMTAFASCSDDDDPPMEQLQPDNGNNSEDGSNKNDNNNEDAETNNTMNIRIGNHTFTATLADNETARAFAALLPMTVTMNELNGNEKYHYLTDNLPTDASRAGTIHEGDLMLYSSNCLVLFYETFSSSYNYTRIGSVDNAVGLAEAVGSGNVNVTFELSTKE